MGRDRAARPEAKPLRLFVAADMSEEAAEALERALLPWRDRLPMARWVARSKWHITLKFLGRTYPRLLGFVEEACREVAAGAAPFEVGLRGMGVFPGPSRARVLWAGLDDPAGGLTSLAQALDVRLSSEFKTEKRPFRPHLTVARFNPPLPFREHMEALERVEIHVPPFAVDRLRLYQSHLHPRGARYEMLEEFPCPV